MTERRRSTRITLKRKAEEDVIAPADPEIKPDVALDVTLDAAPGVAPEITPAPVAKKAKKEKPVKAPKAPKAPKEPKAPKAKKAKKEPKAPKTPKAPKVTKAQADTTTSATSTPTLTPSATVAATLTPSAAPLPATYASAASSASAAVGDEVEPSKAKSKSKAKAKKDKPQILMAMEGQVAEIRARPFVRSCTSQTKVRIGRAANERLYLLSQIPDPVCRCAVSSALHKEFSVLGSTGNVYTVIICQIPKCSCPDFANGNLCKHVLFVLLKVLGVERKSNLLYQKALLPSELAAIYANAPITKASEAMASKKVLQAYKKLTGAADDGGEEEEEEEAGGIKQKPIDSDVCGICFDDMETTDNVVWCKKGCGNNVHKDCFDRWSTAKKREGASVSCVYCRAEWEMPAVVTGAGGTAVEGVRVQGGYVNLSQLSGQSPSSYASYGYGYGYRGYNRYRYHW